MVHPVVFISTEFQSAALYNNAICTGTEITLPVTQETFYELMHGKNIHIKHMLFLFLWSWLFP